MPGVLKSKKLLILILFGTLFQVTLIFPSGFLYKDEIRFWGVHSSDTLWHTAVANRLSQFQFDNPIFANESIKNYHYLSDVFIAFIHKFFQIPLLDVVFRVYPLFLSILIGITVYKLSIVLFKDKKAALWATFFTYFGSSFAYVFRLFGLGTDYWEGNLWVMQSHSVMANLPLASSYVLITLALINLHSYLVNGKRKNFLAVSIFLGALPATKSFSIVTLGSIILIAIYSLLINKQKKLMYVAVTSSVVAFILLSPVITLKPQFIIEPGYFLRTMMEAPDRLDWQKWVLEMQFYKENTNFLHLSRLWLTAFVIFIIGNLGTRILFIFSFDEIRKYFSNPIHLILIISCLIFAILPMILLTHGIAWNSIQFFYYVLFIVGLYAGRGTSILLDRLGNNTFQFLMVIIVIATTLPVGLKTLTSYITNKPNLVITKEELIAFSVIRDKSDSVIIAFPLNGNYNYIAALTGRSLYVGDKTQSIITGMDYDQRIQEVEHAIIDPKRFEKFAKSQNIGWVYLKSKDEEKHQILNRVGNIAYESDKLILYEIK